MSADFKGTAAGGICLSDYIEMMRRRLSALLSCFLVLSFSISGDNACEGMPDQSNPQNTLHATSSSHDHDSPQSSHSHHTSDRSIPPDHCETTTSCAGVVLATRALVSIVCSHAERVVQLAALAPAGQSPDLEPPPPKA